MTQQKGTPFPHCVIPRERSDRGNLLVRPATTVPFGDLYPAGDPLRLPRCLRQLAMTHRYNASPLCHMQNTLNTHRVPCFNRPLFNRVRSHRRKLKFPTEYLMALEFVNHSALVQNQTDRKWIQLIVAAHIFHTVLLTEFFEI